MAPLLCSMALGLILLALVVRDVLIDHGSVVRAVEGRDPGPPSAAAIAADPARPASGVTIGLRSDS